MNDRPGAASPAVGVDELRRRAEAYGIRFVAEVTDDMLDPELVSQVPVEWSRAHCLLPARLDGRPCLLTAEPAHVPQQDDLALLIGQELSPVLAPREAIAGAIERCYYSKHESPREFMQELETPDDAGEGVVSAGNDLLRVAQKAPVTQLVNLILLEAVKQGASDIHFEPFESKLRVRYRIDGVLYEQDAPPKHLQEALTSRLKVMARMDIAEKRLPQDGMTRVRVGEREIDVRVSTAPVAEGERLVLRLLDRRSALLPLTALGMRTDTRLALERIMQAPNGMIVVAGPTGSGKTTTLYAALGKLDASRRNILTIEDPVEYQLPDIGQIQVKPKIGLTFATGLRHILRQDPDVLLVGETRDLETAEIAIRASLTGHLVFTTLHTNDAPGSVLRLVDMGVEPYLVASCLRGVLAQRLVRRLCGKCRKPASLTPEASAALGVQAGMIPEGAPLWEAHGCEACIEGYKGRAGVFELMVFDRDMADAVRRGPVGGDTLRRLGEQKGMTSLVQDGLLKVLDGVTSLDEVRALSGVD